LLKSTTISDPITTAKDIVAEIKAHDRYKAYNIIALTHIGWERDLELANAVEDISIIIGAHSHTGIGGMKGGPRSKKPGATTKSKTLAVSYPYMIEKRDGSKMCVVQAGFRYVPFSTVYL
jgi:2',3'-cyclic-nucleotide 2'-phosphodiesterase (5'-nucleotidase family)